MAENERILYTKWSNDRAENFRIMTQIVERGGTRLVRKSAASSCSAAHIQRMTAAEKKFDALFDGTKFRMNKVLSASETHTDFEYLDGIGYDKILDGYLRNKDLDSFTAAIKLFFDELDKLAVSRFAESAESRHVFGEGAFEDGEASVFPANIDIIFQNVIVTADGAWNVIDYEWTFDFAVPVKFLKCRGLLVYIFSHSKRAYLYETDLFERLGILKSEFEYYKALEEKKFATYVQNASFLNFAESIRKQVVNPYLIEADDSINVYYDTGNGFSEADKDTFFQFPVTVFPREQLKAIRIDPSLRPCIVRGISLKADGKEFSYASNNAWRSDGGALWFDTDDPQLYLELPDEQPSSFTFDMRVIQLDEQSMHDIYQQNEIIKEQGGTIESQDATISRLGEIINERDSTVEQQGTVIREQLATIESQDATISKLGEDFQSYIRAHISAAESAVRKKQEQLAVLYASRSWRLTRPLRAVAGCMRKVLRR